MTVSTNRRERQRAAVRDELRSVAIEVFLTEGFAEAGIPDIARLAGVSERTFYRYFPTKEAAALDWIDDTASTVHEMLRRQRPGVSPADALCEAFIAIMPLAGHASAYHRVMPLVFATPRLLNAYFEHARTWEADVAEVLAERLGTDLDSDPRPALWSAMGFAIAHRVAIEVAARGGLGDYPAILRERFAQAAGFFGP